MRGVFSLLVSAWGALSVGACREPRYVCDRCNVVIVSIDTLRADHVGAYGYERPTTPHLDTLAEDGVLFENAVSQSSWTRPAHMSIFTGLYPSEHGYVGLSDNARLGEDTLTLARVFREQGYTTVAFTGGVNVSAFYGFDRGFDLYRSNGRAFRANLEETRYWLAEEATEPFFLFWHGYDAHSPYTSDAIDRAALELPAMRPHLRLRHICRDEGPKRRIQRVIRQYDAAIHHADRYLGKLLAELDRLSLLDRTVVVVLSDHGEEFLDHGACLHINTLYHEVLRVPLVIHAPGLEPRRIPDLVPASVSIGRTVLDLVGLAARGFPGVSLAGLATGAKIGPFHVVSETRRQISQTRGHGHVRSLTTPEGKLIDWITLGKKEWFDLRRDSRELAPRTSGNELIKAAAELAAWVKDHPRRDVAGRVGETPPAPSAQQARELERELRSLGYVE